MLIRVYNKLRCLLRIYSISKRIGQMGRNVSIAPCHSIYGNGVSIGDNVSIGKQAWIVARPIATVECGNQSPTLKIGEGCTIGQYNEIYATRSIIIEENVLTADRVYISDVAHEYKDISTPVKNQSLKQLRPIVIGEGSWIGIGVSILGASVGKHSIIGSNAVVTHDIPDYSVAVGIPAKVIKRYNFNTEKWEKTL